VRFFIEALVGNGMTNWPTISVHDQSLGLPILKVTLDRLVRTIVCLDRGSRAEEYEDLFQADPFFAVWIAAQASNRGVPAGSESALAAWLNGEGEQILAELDPDPTDELLTPDPGVSAAYLCRLVSTASETGHSVVSLVFAQSPEIDLANDQIANQLMKKMNTVMNSEGPVVSFADWQKVLNWDQRDELFERQLHHQKMLAIKNFAYGASHEINNPLANITSRAQNLVKVEEDVHRRRELSTIETQAHRASSMIADLMVFAQPPSLNLEPVSVKQLATQAMQEMSEFTVPLGLEMEVDDSEDVMIQSDEKACLEIFKIVIQNSIDAMEEGKISLAWQVDENRVFVTVSDNGTPIPEQQLDIVFDPFFSGREAGRGIGFGLTKAWRVMQLHHGDITVSNLVDGVATRLQFVKSS
jgi:signal transduction histidine kinase